MRNLLDIFHRIKGRTHFYRHWLAVKKFWISSVLMMALVTFVALGFVPAQGYAASSEGHGGSSGGEAEGKGAGSEFTYIHLQPLVLPVIGDNGAEQLVTLLIDLQVKDLSVSEKVRAKMPRVQDAILQRLYAGFADGSLREGDKVHIAKVKEAIAAALVKALGEPMVDDVLIQGVAQRML